MARPCIPEWVTYPGDEWIEIAPAEAGIDMRRWERFLKETSVRSGAWEGEAHEGDSWGAVLARGGYLIHVWGNQDYCFQTASLGKAFTWAVFGLAVDAGLVRPDDLIADEEFSKARLYLGEMIKMAREALDEGAVRNYSQYSPRINNAAMAAEKRKRREVQGESRGCETKWGP